MGQLASQVKPVVNGLISEERKTVIKREISVCCDKAALYKQIALISREEFDGCIKELNAELAVTCKGSPSQVCFVANHATSSFNWKAITRVGFFEVDTGGSVFMRRYLSVLQFWKIRNLLFQQIKPNFAKEKFDEFQLVSVQNSFEETPNIGAHCDNETENPSLTTSAVFASVDAVSAEERECCICMDRSSDVSLPCAHCFCKQCTVSWSNRQGDNHKKCPICRQHFGADDELWEMADAPTDEELRDYMNAVALSI